MSGILCRSCLVHAVSIRCLNCSEDRALMCMGCARYHNEIKAFQSHELVPLRQSFPDSQGRERERERDSQRERELQSQRDYNPNSNTVLSNAAHLSSVMNTNQSFRPGGPGHNSASTMSQLAMAQREEALRMPAAYRGLNPARLASHPSSQGQSQGLGQGSGQGSGMGIGPGQGSGPSNPHMGTVGVSSQNAGPGSAYPSPSGIRNKVIHVTPATFHLIRSNALLLEDVKVRNMTFMTQFDKKYSMYD